MGASPPGSDRSRHERPYAAWLAANDPHMPEFVAGLGFVSPWDQVWATRVRHDLEDLADFYADAAARGDAVAKYLDG